MSLNDLPTDELLELLPDNLQVARNSLASSNDRYRFYNLARHEFTTNGFATVRELILDMLERTGRSERAT